MKWIAAVLLVLGSAEIAAGTLYRRSIQARQDEWAEAKRQIDLFERRIAIANLARTGTETVTLTIPDDAPWRLVARKLQFKFVIRRLDPDIHFPGRTPTETPYETWTADVTVNGTFRTLNYCFDARPLQLSFYSNVWHWQAAGPVRLGDRIEVRLKSIAKPAPNDRVLLLGIALQGEERDHPERGWKVGRLIGMVLQWIGIGFCGMGIVFAINANREAKFAHREVQRP